MIKEVTVDLRSNLPYSEFVSDYLIPSKPVVFSDAASKWGAMNKWTPDFFKNDFAERQMSADGKTFQTSEFIDILHASTTGSPAPYMHNQNIGEVFPELLNDVMPLPDYFKPNWLVDRYFPPALDKIMRGNSIVELYIGGPGGKFPVIHYDSIYTHAFLTQIYGQKELFLWGPDQSEYMYALRRNNVSEVNDATKPDLEKFPLFQKASGCSLILEPGQTIFIPGGWWHTARMLTESITVSVNVANASNWANVSADLVQDQSGLKKSILTAYLKYLGSVKSKRGYDVS